jgi:hypothetical protein
MKARLIVRPPSGSRREVRLGSGVVTIGRSPDCSIVLDFNYISRVHARIERIDPAYVVTDSGSTNGTFVNGERIGAPQRLTSGDFIAVADVSITFLDSDDDEVTHTLKMPDDCPVRCDPLTREIWIDDAKIELRLSVQEFELMLILCNRYGTVCPRHELAMAIWGEGKYDFNMLHRLVHRLKQKLGNHQGLLQTVPGVGYALGIGRVP